MITVCSFNLKCSIVYDVIAFHANFSPETSHWLLMNEANGKKQFCKIWYFHFINYFSRNNTSIDSKYTELDQKQIFLERKGGFLPIV